MTWFKKHRITILLVAVFLIGVGFLVYPTFSDYWNKVHQARAVMQYTEQVSDLDTDQYEELWDEAVRYNEALSETGMKWNMTEEEQAEYERCLSVTDSGIMAYIDIPKIDCQLPIYHGTDEKVLQTSIGHLAGTSLPVGGESTHCVLSGHRGLPSARLFTDLDKLVTGDVFMIQTLDETLTYEVDQILIIEPTDLSSLQIVQGKDYCTLVTCTPYGINTHRLLVRGHRVDTVRPDLRVPADAIQIEPTIVAPILAVPMLILLAIGVIVFADRRRKSR